MAFALLTSCDERANECNSENPSVSNSTGNETCIKEYMTKYDQLLPLEIIKKHYAVPADAKKQYDFLADAQIHDKDVYEYTWESGRMKKMVIAGREMEYPSDNRIGLRWVGSHLFMIQGKPTPIENFRSFYKNSTEEAKNAAFKQAAESIKDKGFDSKTVEEATNIAKGLSADEVIFKDIQGVSEVAAWRIKEKELGGLGRR